MFKFLFKGVKRDIEDKVYNILDDFMCDLEEKLSKENVTLQYYATSEYGLTRAYSTDSGMDIYSNETFLLNPKERHFFSTGIHLIIPEGYDVVVRPRSGLAYKFGIDTLAGIVDEAYTGEVKIGLINHSSQPVEIKKGDKIAQLIMREVNQNQPKAISKDMFDILAKYKERGEKAFGSSDIKKEEV